MSVLHRAYRLFQSEGWRALAAAVTKRLVGKFDFLYQRIKPTYKSYSVGDASAEFNMAYRRLDQHDFVDDLRSERRLIERVLSVVDDDDVFYDIGANVGIYSCLVGTQLSSGTVVAFEPTPDAFGILQSNVERNDIDARLFDVALTNENGTAHMSVRGQTGHELSDGDGETVDVETRRADDLVTEHGLPSPDVIKIDIEGAEYLALDGFRETLADVPCHHLFCEIHSEKVTEIGGSAEEVEELLRSQGFELEYLGERRENYFVEATHPSVAK
ncbi:FkbM family methyltransferase [Haloplanus rubicundus]|uniref:FkbM family methyltransferase n=1 Tax=Haloplanus rubicundus TaxID=1547898 RepID=A0A345EG04_9EURY|nr:FkbM family methyltransferase [Haloplanus rubicundus]AXG07707.1 FkbM family methyltransferase [Haloplanus rubicundus]AXG11126.1 FkbM family methyltransferase [Haloplanus rubicundus]